MPTRRVSRSEGAELYRNPWCGLRIDEVWADGSVIPARLSAIDFDDLDTSTIRSASRWHIYQLELEKLALWKDRWLVTMHEMSEDDWMLQSFYIPVDTKSLRVRYRPRFPLNDYDSPLEASITIVKAEGSSGGDNQGIP
jgi:hypothetical protein